MTQPTDEFELYDLRVEVVAPPGAKLWCNARPGDWFELRGELLHLPPEQGFSIYSIAAVLPLLAAKQRASAAADWMSTDCEVACPDPNCPSRLRITRLGKRSFSHAATTAVAMIPRTTLAHAHDISRLIKGGWHLAGDHGPIDPVQAVRDMATFVEAGITTFDCADIYTNVEEMIGRFLRSYPSLAPQVRVHTKFVPNLSDLPHLDAELIERTIDRSLARLGVERLDLVQFHWWDLAVPGYVEAALTLDRLRAKGKIAHVAVTNFDVAHLSEIVEAGVPVVSHQLQYSLLDTRPAGQMLDFCRRHEIAYLCYGTVAGGFLSDRWLGQPEPLTITNRSLIKYKLIVEDFGGWNLFQELLRTLRRIADRHACDIATVATRAVLDRENVAAAIVGATNTSHLDAHRRIGALLLTAEDHAEIAAVTAKSPGLEGDVYTLERDRNGRHGRIMKYELS
jgi:uncharacterized repeat protein (TIGR04076 family)